MQLRKIVVLLAVTSLLSTTIVACKDSDKGSPTPSAAKKQEDPQPNNSGDDSDGPSSPSPNQSQTPAPKPENKKEEFKTIKLSEVPAGYYEFSSFRYYSTRNKQAGLALKAKHLSEIRKGDEVRVAGKENVSASAVQFPLVLVSNDKTIHLHDFTTLSSSVTSGRQPDWSWTATYNTMLTANVIFTGFKSLGPAYNFAGRFKSYEVSVSNSNLRITSVADEITFEVNYTRKELTSILESRPESQVEFDKSAESMKVRSVLDTVYIPMFETQQLVKIDDSSYPHAYLVAKKEKEDSAKYAQKLHSIGMWIKGTISEINYGNGKPAEIRNTLTWTTDLMEWHHQLKPLNAEKILSALKTFRTMTEIAKNGFIRDAQNGPDREWAKSRQSFIQLEQAKLDMIDEAIDIITNKRTSDKSGPWRLLQ